MVEGLVLVCSFSSKVRALGALFLRKRSSSFPAALSLPLGIRRPAVDLRYLAGGSSDPCSSNLSSFSSSGNIGEIARRTLGTGVGDSGDLRVGGELSVWLELLEAFALAFLRIDASIGERIRCGRWGCGIYAFNFVVG